MKNTFSKALLLSAVSLLLLSCSNLFGGGDSGSSSSESKPAEAQNQPKTITVTGDIRITDELTGSGAIPEEYRSLFSSIENSKNNSQERTAFPTVPTSGYYVTATAEGKDPVTVTPTTTANGASFSMNLPAEDPEKVWTIEAGMTASFNGSQVVILKDTCTATPPTFYHEFVIKPLASGNGNVDLIINYETANTADELELYFGDTKITVATSNGETLSTTQITLKNREAGAHKAKLVFKKNGYVVYTDYQGINIFPNMTTNTWVSSGGNGPVTGSTYKLTDTLVQDYLLTQIYVGSTTVGGTTVTASDTTGNGTVFAPFATITKAIDYLQKRGDTSKAYTIWISGEVTGAQTISDGTAESPTPVKASSLTISGVTGNTNDSLKGGTSGSVLLIDTAVPVTITKLKITGGTGTNSVVYGTTKKKCGGGLNVKRGTVTLSTDTWITGNNAEYGGGVYVASGAKLFMSGNSVVGDAITGDTTTASPENYANYTNCANYATGMGGGIYVNGGELYLGYTNGTTPTLDSNFTGGVIKNVCLQTGNSTGNGGGIYCKGAVLKMAKGKIAYNYSALYGGGIKIEGAASVLDFSGGSIEKNTTIYKGGGGYITDAKVYMSGTALIGDSGTSMTQVSDFSNKAIGKGNTDDLVFSGGLWMDGSSELYLGYTPPVTEGEDPVADNNFTGGICHNYSAKHAGGLYNSNLIKINKGHISYNKSENSGGGCYFSGGGASFTMTDGSFTSNTCGENGSGGAIYYNQGTVAISGGTFTSNTCGSNGNGGAILVQTFLNYQSFQLSGSVSFPDGSEKNNDIYLNDSLLITLGTNISGGAAITSSTWKRGNQIFKAASGITITDDMLSQFSLTDTEWKIVKTGTNTNTKGCIDADIWVASSGTDTGRASDVNAPPETASERNGTKAKPYATIEEAVSQVWDTGTTKTLDFTIKISGSVSGNQTIADTVTNAKTITLLGDENATKKELNAGDSGTVLTVTSKVPLTIQNLTITGGNSVNDGGGIKMEAENAKLTLTKGAIVKGNRASDGGGIYFTGTNGMQGLLIMNSTASINDNTATVNGGGLYIQDAKLCMAGEAIIGDTTNTIASATAKSNSANLGGGVYNNNGEIWLGYSAANSNSKSDLSAGYGICRNFVSDTAGYTPQGGGIYNYSSDGTKGKVTINTGSVSFNCANSENSQNGLGGGIYNTNNITMSGGELKGNQAYNGAGVYNASSANRDVTMYFSGGIIGNHASENAKPNSANNYGAGIYNDSGCFVCMSGTAVVGYIDNSITTPATQENLKFANIALNGSGIYNNGSLYIGYSGIGDSYKDDDFSGGIYYNYAPGYGGGIYNAGTLKMHRGKISYNGAGTQGGGVYYLSIYTNSFLMSGGSLENNKANSKGGAIFIDIEDGVSPSPLTLAGSAAIPSTGTKKLNDIYLNNDSRNYETINVYDENYNPGATTKQIWITPKYCHEGTPVIAGDSVANAYKYFYVTKENTTDLVPTWAVNSHGGLFSAYVVTGASAITPDKLTAGSDYTFVFPENMTDYGLACAFQQLFGGAGSDDAPAYGDIPQLGSGTVIDLSRLSITSFSTSPTFYSSDTKEQSISKVILPATLSADAFDAGTIHYCFQKVGEFEVDSSAENIKCYNGAVYNSDYSKLLCYPGGASSFSLHSNTTEIGDYACCAIAYTNSNGISVPNTITKIGKSAFRYSAICKITFPSNTNFTEIPESCCDMCVNLQQVTIPSNVKTISSRAFFHCVINSNITLPSGLTTIGKQAFERAFGSSANFTLSVPSSVTKIGKGAFLENTSANFSVSLGSTTGWTKATEETGTYTTVNSTDVTWENLKSSSSLGGYWLKK